jgi:hypothetical protein
MQPPFYEVASVEAGAPARRSLTAKSKRKFSHSEDLAKPEKRTAQ